MATFLIVVGFLMVLGSLSVLLSATKKSERILTLAGLGMIAAIALFTLGVVIARSGYPSSEAIPSGNHEVLAAGEMVNRWYIVIRPEKAGWRGARFFVLPRTVVEERTGADKKLVVVREEGLSRVTLFLPETP